jgi:hypothetical protein
MSSYARPRMRSVRITRLRHLQLFEASAEGFELADWLSVPIPLVD